MCNFRELGFSGLARRVSSYNSAPNCDFIELIISIVLMQGSEAVSYEDPSLEESVFRSTSLFPHEALLQQFKNYRPHSDIVNMQSLASSSNLKLKKYRTAAFYGEFVNGKRHGKGIMLYNNGRQY
jgi:hypothetical protein